MKKILIIILLIPCLLKAQEHETYKVPVGQSVLTVTQSRLDDSLSAIRDAIDSKQPAGSYLVAADIISKANLASPAFTGFVSTTGSLGYTTGAGGTVTQNANKGTAVTINKISGQITMNNAALAAAAEVSFTVNNSTVSSTDVVIVNIQSVGTAGSYFVTVGSVSNGAFTITLGNVSTGSLSQALVLNFAVIKSVNN
jgi:hypothetical protein